MDVLGDDTDPLKNIKFESVMHDILKDWKKKNRELLVK